MTSTVVRVRLFIGSYSPLFLIAAVRFDQLRLEVAMAAVGVLGIVTTILLVRASHRLAADPFDVANVADRGPEVAGYLATYLLPFVMAPTPTGRDLAAYGLLLIVLAIVYVQSDMLATNPLLYLLGYRVFRLTTETGFRTYLVSRSEPTLGSTIHAVRLADGVLIEKVQQKHD